MLLTVQLRKNEFQLDRASANGRLRPEVCMAAPTDCCDLVDALSNHRLFLVKSPWTYWTNALTALQLSRNGT